MESSEIIFGRDGILGRITLNRPKALNALTHAMCAAMLAQLREWASDESIRAVLIDAVPGRAFCAGGDIRAIYEAAKRRDGSASAFFASEYRLNTVIRRFPKPYVALIDGFAFGGGLGISVHGSRRVVSENALAGMPETGIGLFPDIGASYFLNQCPGEIGMYLALTGERLKAADLLYTGLATHFVPSARLAEIAPRIAHGEMPDAALAMIQGAGRPPLVEQRGPIDRAFAGASVEAILDALSREGEWGEKTATHLATLSPTSLKVTYRAMREGKSLDFDACMRMEYRLASHLVESHDFGEGVRALLIDKHQKPRWHPPHLGDIRDADIARIFASLGSHELTL